MAQNEFNLQKDRRVFERIPISLSLTLIDLNIKRELEARTCDVSVKGLGIVNRESLKPGDRLELWLNMPDKKQPLYIRGTVIWVNLQETDKYRAGISLEKAEFMGLSRVFR